MIFADYDELDTAKEKLINELKTQVTNAFNDIFTQCWMRAYDIWGLCLNVTKPEFLKFSKGHKQEWCDKMSLLFETSFECVVRVMYETTRTINIEMLHFIIDDFFDHSGELFYEDWFLCSKCFKTTDHHDEERDTVICMSCENTTTQT